MPSINKRKKPIGVFDSGLGGLTVVKALMKYLPSEDIIYFGDTARVPYGTKSKDSIIRFSMQNVHILLKHKVKIIIVACNTSSSYALAILKKSFHLPIIGVIDPGVKKAISITKNKRIGIIATPATIDSRAYEKRIHAFDSSLKVVSQACPLFVPLVEEGWYNKKAALMIAQEYLKKLKTTKIDTLILGCTHYPLLKDMLKKVMGPKISLVDSAKEVALETKALLEKRKEDCPVKHKARYQFLSSDVPNHFRKSAKKFLGRAIPHVRKVIL